MLSNCHEKVGRTRPHSSPKLIQRNGEPTRHSQLRPEEPKHGEKNPKDSMDLGAEIWSTAPTTGQKARNPTTIGCTGGPASPLPVTPAGEAAGGEGEGSQRKDGDSQGAGGEEREQSGGWGYCPVLLHYDH
jgi:hypothetical protein